MVTQLHSDAESKLRGAVNCLPPSISAHSIIPGFKWVLCSFNTEENSGLFMNRMLHFDWENCLTQPVRAAMGVSHGNFRKQFSSIFDEFLCLMNQD